jgi:hypothetical protein
VVEELLRPDLGDRGGEAAEACGQHVHVQHGHLGPGAEGGVESEV